MNCYSNIDCMLIKVKVLFNTGLKNELKKIKNQYDEKKISNEEYMIKKELIINAYNSITNNVIDTVNRQKKQDANIDKLCKICECAIQCYSALLPWSSSIVHKIEEFDDECIEQMKLSGLYENTPHFSFVNGFVYLNDFNGYRIFSNYIIRHHAIQKQKLLENIQNNNGTV